MRKNSDLCTYRKVDMLPTYKRQFKRFNTYNYDKQC